MLFLEIRRKVGRRDFQFEQVLAAGQMQGAGSDRRALALFENVGDVFAAISVESERILQGAGDLIHPIDFA